MPTGERVLVTGGTQGTGYHIARRLLQDGYRVRVLAQNEAKARARFGDTVEIMAGHVTKLDTLLSAFAGVDHVIVTVGVTKRPASERLVKAVEYDGTFNVLAAAKDAGLAGRFMYMSAVGTTRWAVLSFLLNLIKGNTLRWRRRAEEEIRRSGLDYTIVHAGILTDAPGGRKSIGISQDELPMAPKYRISREDVAEVFVRALHDPHTRNTTFDAVWTWEKHRQSRASCLLAWYPVLECSRRGPAPAPLAFVFLSQCAPVVV